MGGNQVSPLLYTECFKEECAGNAGPSSSEGGELKEEGGKKSRRANWKEMRRRERQKQYTFEAGREGGTETRENPPEELFPRRYRKFSGRSFDRSRGSEFLQSAPSRLHRHPLGGCGCKLVSRTKARPRPALSIVANNSSAQCMERSEILRRMV